MTALKKVSGEMPVYLLLGVFWSLLPYILFVRRGKRGAIGSFAVLLAGLVWGDISTNVEKYQLSKGDRWFLILSSLGVYAYLVGFRGWARCIAYPLFLFIGWLTPLLCWDYLHSQASPIVRRSIERRVGVDED